MAVVTKQLVALQAKKTDQTKGKIHAGIICAFLLAYFTGGMSLVVAGAAGAAGLGVNEIYHRYDTSSHKSRITDGKFFT